MLSKSLLNSDSKMVTIFFIVLVVWSVFWKGFALWKAARGKQKYWFIAILLVNSVGLLDILFLLFFRKKSGDKLKK